MKYHIDNNIYKKYISKIDTNVFFGKFKTTNIPTELEIQDIIYIILSYTQYIKSIKSPRYANTTNNNFCKIVSDLYHALELYTNDILQIKYEKDHLMYLDTIINLNIKNIDNDKLDEIVKLLKLIVETRKNFSKVYKCKNYKEIQIEKILDDSQRKILQNEMEIIKFGHEKRIKYIELLLSKLSDLITIRNLSASTNESYKSNESREDSSDNYTKNTEENSSETSTTNSTNSTNSTNKICVENNKMPDYDTLYDFGFQLNYIKDDGNCQYRAIADQIFNDQNKYKEIKKNMLTNLENIINTFVKETGLKIHDNEKDDLIHSVKYYMKEMSWGDNFTLQAIAETYKEYCINVYYLCKIDNVMKLKLKYKYPESNCDDLKPINLYLHKEYHYSSLTENIISIDKVINGSLDLNSNSIMKIDWSNKYNDIIDSYKQDIKLKTETVVNKELFNFVHDNLLNAPKILKTLDNKSEKYRALEQFFKGLLTLIKIESTQKTNVKEPIHEDTIDSSLLNDKFNNIKKHQNFKINNNVYIVINKTRFITYSNVSSLEFQNAKKYLMKIYSQ